MNKRKVLALSVVLIVLVAGCLVYAGTLFAQTPTLYWGSSGADVSKVQSKLKDWGYYTGPVDGYYGATTFEAVKSFQSKNGLTADGVCGPSTWQALGFSTAPRTTPSYTPSRGASGRDDVRLLAHLVMGEAGQEPYMGKVAVAAVILNRVASDQFPNTLAGVIYQPNAFESITNGVANTTPTDECVRAAEDALNGWDPTYGCLFFWNPYKPVSSWIWSRQIQTQIGDHVFAK